jgi:hypothetical protein
MSAKYVIERIRAGFATLHAWGDGLDPEERAALDDGALRRMCFLDTFWRMQETTPLIEATERGLRRRGEEAAAEAWAAHRADEAGHDHIVRADVSRLFGGEAAAAAALAAHPMAPPTAAMVAYFHWQAERGDPHTVMALRLFEELFVAEHPALWAQNHAAFAAQGVQTFKVHEEADAGHAADCVAYLDTLLPATSLPALLWSVDFVAACLAESHLWAARATLRP